MIKPKTNTNFTNSPPVQILYKRIKTQTITKQDNWKYTFTDLPKYVDGKKVTYTVKEKMIEGYTVKITGDQNTGFEITNTKIPDKPKLSKIGLSSNITIIFTTLTILGIAFILIRKHEEN